jgi:hypothetical protein
MEKLSLLYLIIANYFVRMPRVTLQVAVLLITTLLLLVSTQWGYACDPGTSGCGGG